MRTSLAAVALVCAIGVTQPAQAAPTPQPGATYPAWTGAQYPYAQHFELMMLHFDEAAVAAAQVAEQHAKSAPIRDLARNVLRARNRDIDQARGAYRSRYGAEPPAWPGPGAGYGPGMMGGGYGPGMMGGGYGPGTMGGGYGPGPNGRAGRPYGPGYGPAMMGFGDTYQVMMGWNPATASTGDVDRGFLLRLMQSDAMEIAMASATLSVSDRPAQDRARALIADRTQELQHISSLFDSEYPPGK
ncbi:MAG TPA: DUF305 domain-containing protein [Candidatus Dormibacteraeota bacterium]|nr:DUF305 domain-containing protein [Candidatus Dormibacteraeota bacterium]